MSLKFMYIITKFHGRQLDRKCKKSLLSAARPTGWPKKVSHHQFFKKSY